MIFGHRSLRRRFLPYVLDTLSPAERRSLENHLAGCASCREAFVRLKAGHECAAKLARNEEERSSPAPAFPPVLAAAVRGGAAGRRWEGLRMRGWLAMSAPRTAAILASVVVAQAILLAVFNWGILFGTRPAGLAMISGIDINRFRILEINELPRNAHPHVATEGYVRNVWMDDEEKTLHFMLASGPDGESPFVVCEILNPKLIAAPRAGSWVKVYGVARYDAQTGRQWHEVNPVLDLAVVKR